MPNNAPPTDQRSGVRPLAFTLDDGFTIRSPITLKVRPEDLTRTEPSRISVNQTMGRDIAGWSDNFGPGLPSVTIAGHTGWRSAAGSGKDGVLAFLQLNDLVMKDFHAAKQRAINTGLDPASVKLIFIDMLDGFTWNVSPMVFVLRRSRSRPLLMQYNINLQAVSTSVDTGFAILPFGQNVAAGMRALSGILAILNELSTSIEDWVDEAVRVKDEALAPVAATAAEFSALSYGVYQEVYSAVSAIQGGFTSTANSLILIARDLASVGVNVYRTLAAIDGIPQNLKYNISRVSSAYTEVLCIFQNSLRPKRVYQNYDGLYGASNCSSTTGGRGPSPYANTNVFNLIQPASSPVQISGEAAAGISGIGRMDPVLKPVSIEEVGRLLGDINDGIRVNQSLVAA